MVVLVLLGGKSPEREISIRSGKEVSRALTKCGYKVIELDPSDDSFHQKMLEIKDKIDVVFIALHGAGGEDGSIQGYLETLGLPYTGSKVLASSLAMNKIYAKRIFLLNGIPTPPFEVITKNKKIKHLSFPVVVKPSTLGSTIGVSIVRNKKELMPALKKAFQYDNEIIVEKYIKGKEITAGILNNKVLPLIEIVPVSSFYDYKSKYTPGMAKHIIPPRISEMEKRKIQEIALKAHKSLNCTGATRVDMILSEEGEVFVLEVNTIPGLTPISLLPEAARAAGISFEKLIKIMIKDALKNEKKN
jgi:D-alanine-D-alanine ligase